MKKNFKIIFSPQKVKKKKIKNRRLKYGIRYKKRFNKRTYDIGEYILIKFIIVIIFLIVYFLINKNTIQRFHKFYPIFDLKTLHNTYNYSMIYDEYNETIDESYKYLQNYFCENQNESMNQDYENKIQIAKVDFNGTNFDMFVYKVDDIVSGSIISSHQWEGFQTKEIIKALEFYSKKKNLQNKDVYFIDVGANVGWFTFFTGKYGYKVLSFEANEINNYILYKNYCLNKDVSLTIINKGLDEEDKKCILKTVIRNIGNGAIYCENREKNEPSYQDVFNNIELTKLSRYIKFLKDKNIALLKIDVEGDEGKVIKGGQELISKYHIPFISMEFCVSFLQSHQTNVLEFLKLFENNGYKFSLVDFFSKKYVSSEELIKNINNNNLYVVYEKFLD